MNKLIIVLGFGLITAVASVTGASAAKVEDVVAACDRMNDAKDGSCSMKIKGNGMEVCTANGCAYCPADGSRTCSKAARGGGGSGRGLGGVVKDRGLASGVSGGTAPSLGTKPVEGWRSGARLAPVSELPGVGQSRIPLRPLGSNGGLVSVG